jgi:hypothetical protein
MTVDITREAKDLLPQLDPAFERGVAVLHTGSDYIDARFLQLMSMLTPGGAYASTCTVLDIFAGKSLRYERSAGQRGFCMFFNTHPLSLGSEMAWAAIIHEAGHYLTDRHPSRDEPDEKKALRDWWGSWGGDNGGHDNQWRRACAHLSYRAAAIGGIAVDVTSLFEDHGGSAVMQGLRSELVSRIDEPIESILSYERVRGANHSSPAGRLALDPYRNETVEERESRFERVRNRAAITGKWDKILSDPAQNRPMPGGVIGIYGKRKKQKALA